MSTVATRRRALSLYRQLLRSSKKMPTFDRQEFVKAKTRNEFREKQWLQSSEEIEFHLKLAEYNLDTVYAQANHLSRMFSDPKYFIKEDLDK